jgi:hypothetical protein
MPKKVCCCEDKSVWVAIPCRYYGKIVFAGYQKGFTGFSDNIKGQLQPIFTANHGIFGTCGPYGGYHPFWKFPDSSFPVVTTEGGPPIKITGTGPCDSTLGGINWGGYGGQECFTYTVEVDETRKVLYKVWGAGGGGANSEIYGGNGSYNQIQKNYGKNDYVSVGYGGFGYDNVKTSGACYGAQGTDWTAIAGSSNFIATIPNVLKTTGLGGQGYNAWGGGAAYIAPSTININSAYIISSAGGGAGAFLTTGGHGGITHGLDSPGQYGGKGACGSVSGVKGSNSASDGIGSMGGRAAPVIGTGYLETNIFGGGGGGGGYAGGGGGGTGFGGGGGSSKPSSSGTTYSHAGSDLGPPNICDPDYFITMPSGEYIVPGLGGSFIVQARNKWAPDPIQSEYSIGYNGQSGKVVATFAALHCPCNDAYDTIPEKSYICLSAAQAKHICDSTTDCCEGTTGSNNDLNNPNSGWSGNSGFSGSVCGYGANFGDTGDSRPAGACAGRGETGTAEGLGPGGGSGGYGLGAIPCVDISGFSGYTGSASGFGYPNESRSGELNSIVYKTFKYEGELYYLLGPCGVDCSPEYKIPEGATFSDIGCREWAACCEVLYGTPLCKATDPTDISCWTNNYCPCTPEKKVEPFIVCEGIDNYPDQLFWTRIDDWYYAVGKTTYWQVFGEPEIKKYSSISIILEDPCPPCVGGGFGGGDCTGGDQGGLGNNNGGDPTQYNCCVDISEEESILPSPYGVKINASFQYQGKGPYTIGSCVITDNDCTCKKWDYTETPFSDTLDNTIATAAYCSFDDIAIYGYHEITRSIEVGVCDPNTGNFGCPSGQPPVPTFQEMTYRIHYGGYYGSLLEEKCYSPILSSCPPDPFYIKKGYPTEQDDPDGLISKGDPAFQLISVCEFDYATCAEGYGDCTPFPLIIQSGPFSCEYVNCDGYNYPKESGKTIVTNGCRLTKLISKLQEISGQSQKFTVIDLGSPLDYWVGGPRSRFKAIPGDELYYIDDYNIVYNGTVITQTCTRTYYCRSPSFNIELIFGAKSIEKCCSTHPYMRYLQSGCGNYDSTGWELPYGNFSGSSICVQNPDNYIQCIQGRPSPVPTFKTLAQYENNPSAIPMQPDRAWTCLGGLNGGPAESNICPDRYDDFDLPATCTITSL